MSDKHKEELPLFTIPEPKPYGAFEDTLHVRQLHFYISGPLEEPEHYVEMIHAIRSASEHDVVHLHLNTPGGYLDTGVQIINAIDATLALVVTHLEGEVCSMGALLFLAGHQMVAYDYSLLMFHNYSGGIVGKGHELKASVEAMETWYTTIQEKICYPFLTKTELKRISDGQDIWMQHDEVGKRLQKLQKAAEKKQAELEAAEQD